VQTQQHVIEILQGRLQVASAAEAACNMNAVAAANGAAAAARAGACGPVAAMHAQAAGMAISSVLPMPVAATRATEDTSGEEEEEDEEENEEERDEEDRGGEQASPAEVAQQQALLVKIAALEAEKRRVEEQLRHEQGEVAAQVRELQDMMAALGMSGG